MGWPGRSLNPIGSWLWIAMGLVTLALDILLLMIMFRIPIPSLLAIAVLIAQDGVYAWRSIALRRARRADSEGVQ
jgi:hypothetical protein